MNIFVFAATSIVLDVPLPHLTLGR
jgi:hypothetical protein